MRKITREREREGEVKQLKREREGEERQLRGGCERERGGGFRESFSESLRKINYKEEGG